MKNKKFLEQDNLRQCIYITQYFKSEVLSDIYPFESTMNPNPTLNLYVVQKIHRLTDGRSHEDRQTGRLIYSTHLRNQTESWARQEETGTGETRDRDREIGADMGVSVCVCRLESKVRDPIVQ